MKRELGGRRWSVPPTVRLPAPPIPATAVRNVAQQLLGLRRHNLERECEPLAPTLAWTNDHIGRVRRDDIVQQTSQLGHVPEVYLMRRGVRCEMP